MGNIQQKEIDLLELYLRDPGLRQNVSLCVNETGPSATDITWADCLGQHSPGALVSRPYQLPWDQQATWATLFVVMIVIAATGNAIVVWIIVAHRRMRTITNLFLLNLACADFLLATGNASFNFVFMLESHWPFGEVFCVGSNFLANLTVATSVFTILAMSIDRFVAIVRPMRPRMSKGRAYLILAGVWGAGGLLSSPPLLYSATATFVYADGSRRTICYLLWPDGPAQHSYADHVYNIVFLVVTYVVPMVCMAFTYSWVGCVLWGSKVIGENTVMQNDVVRSKQRVVHMLVAVVGVFGVCWLPYHAYFLYVYHHPEAVSHQHIQHVYLAIYWVAMSNSCYNPLVYYWMNARFREYFRAVMCWPRRGLQRRGFCRGKVPGGTSKREPKTATFTCSTRSRSCRVTLPLPRAANILQQTVPQQHHQRRQRREYALWLRVGRAQFWARVDKQWMVDKWVTHTAKCRHPEPHYELFCECTGGGCSVDGKGMVHLKEKLE